MLVLRNDREKVEDTIRHEIAHALCEPRQGHGPQWKEMCKRTGAKPERCYDDEVDAPKGDWQAICGGCGTLHHKFRRPKRDRWCARKECRAANPTEYGQGRFNPVCKLVWRHKNALPDPSEAQRRKAVEATKARLREAEAAQGVDALHGCIVYQCAKCDRQSISYGTACPVCGGDMMLESKLRAEKEKMRSKIAELEKKQRGHK